MARSIARFSAASSARLPCILARPERQDRATQDRQLADHRGDIEAFAQAIEGVPLRGLELRRAPPEVIDDVSELVDHGRDVIDELVRVEVARVGHGPHDAPPLVEDVIAVLSQEGPYARRLSCDDVAHAAAARRS